MNFVSLRVSGGDDQDLIAAISEAFSGREKPEKILSQVEYLDEWERRSIEALEQSSNSDFPFSFWRDNYGIGNFLTSEAILYYLPSILISQIKEYAVNPVNALDISICKDIVKMLDNNYPNEKIIRVLNLMSPKEFVIFEKWLMWLYEKVSPNEEEDLLSALITVSDFKSGF